MSIIRDNLMGHKMSTIKQKWEEFRDQVIPEDAPNEQIRDMELAFYSGTFAMLNLTTIINFEEEDKAAEMMMGLLSEARRFYTDRENEDKD